MTNTPPQPADTSPGDEIEVILAEYGGRMAREAVRIERTNPLLLNPNQTMNERTEAIRIAKDRLNRLMLTREREAEVRAMKAAQSRVLRRTEIPADAKNPTRDYVVVLGEEIADIIQRDIAAIDAQLNKEETDGDAPTHNVPSKP